MPKEKRQNPEGIAAGKLFGLTKDPVKKFEFQMYFLVEATVSTDGEILDVTKSKQSWMLFEARHKLERAVEESLMQIQKDKPNEKTL